MPPDLSRLPSERSPWRSLAFLLALGALLWGWNYGLWDLEGADEGRYVQVAKEILAEGNWLVPTLHGEPYDEKPPLPFWLMAAGLTLTGGEPTAWGARLPSVLFGLGTILLVYLIGRHLWGDRIGLVSALILMTAPLFARQTPTARLDIFFTGWLTAAVAVWLTAPAGRALSWPRAGLFWICLAGGTLTKGPLALIVVLAAPLVECWHARSWAPWRALRPLAGLGGLGGLVIGWLAIVGWRAGADMARDLLDEATLERFLQAAHDNPPWYYLYSLFASTFTPWTILAAAAMVHLVRSRKAGLPPGLRPILAWAVIPLLALHLSTGKRHQYLLPVLPPLALLVGWYAEEVLSVRRLAGWAPKVALGVGLFVAGGLLTLGLIPYKWPELFWEAEIYVEELHAGILIVAALVIGGLGLTAARVATARGLIALLIGLMFTVDLAYLTAVQGARSPRNSSRLFARGMDYLLRPDETRIGALDEAARPHYHVYGHYRVVEYDDAPETFAAPETLPRLIVAREKDQDDFAAEARQAGYQRGFKVRVAGEDLLIYERGGPTAAASGPPPLRFAFAGDTGTGDDGQRRVGARVEELHRGRGLSAVFLLGDNLYGVKPFPIAVNDRFLRPYAPLVRARVPFFAALGNHDDDTPDRRAGELNTPFLHMRNRPYYSVAFGDDLITFFVLDSETLADDPRQLHWLGRALEESRSRHRVLILHRPMLASQIDHGPDPEIRRLLEPLLSRAPGVDLVLAGHNHVYERWADARGVPHVTLGSGGKLTTDPIPDDPGRLVGYNQARAFGWMEADAAELRFQAVSEFGEVVDRFTIPPAEQPGQERPSAQPGGQRTE